MKKQKGPDEREKAYVLDNCYSLRLCRAHDLQFSSNFFGAFIKGGV
jgi:hypothetical protein